MNKPTKVLLIAMLAIVLVFAVLTFLNYWQWQNSNSAVIQNNPAEPKNNYSNTQNNANNQLNQNPDSPEPQEEEIVLREIIDRTQVEKFLAIADQNEYYQNFIKGKDFSVKAFDLNAEQIKKFREKNNAIYLKIPEKDLVQLDFESQENGTYLMIIDAVEGKVLFFTKIMMLNLG